MTRLRGRPSAAVTLAALLAAAPAGAAPARVRPRHLEARVTGALGRAVLDVEATLALAVEGGGDELALGLGPDLALRSAWLAGAAVPFYRRGDAVVLAALLQVGDARVTLRYEWPLGRPLDRLDAVLAHRSWWPHVLGEEPAAPHPVTARIAVELPRPWMAAGPGEAAVEHTPGGRRFVWSSAVARPAHPIVVGRFAERAREAGGVHARVLLPPGEDARAGAFLEHVLSAAAFFRRAFGSPGHAAHTLVAVPLPRGQRGFTFPGLVVLAAADVAETAEFPHRILAHEVAHNWWSLDVDFPDRDDRWLAEGLPTYSALLFLEERGGADTLRVELANSRRIALATREPLPLAQGARMRGPALYTQSYHKAAWVLHMLRVRLGREAFLAALGDLFRAHAGRSASARDLRAVLERRGGGDLGGFWRDWVESSRVPTFEVSWRRAGQNPCRLAGEVRQRQAAVRAPLRLRARAGPRTIDTVVVVGPGRTEFEAACPDGPVVLEVDPDSEVLHAGARAIER